MTRSVVDILGEEAISRIRLPIEQACGLPRQAYTSQEFFDLEQQRLFPRTWMGIGFTNDVPDPGDAVPMVVAGVPIILCRGKDGEIRAFHNVCRHRAAMVLEKPAKGANVLRCPYHAWAWDLEGKLRAMPYFDGTPDGKGCHLKFEDNGLVPVRIGVWHHWIFVNLDGNAPPLDDYLSPLNKLNEAFDLSATRLGHSVDWEYDGNWKFQNDNWETYHHIWVHPGIFSKMSDDLDMEARRPRRRILQWDNVVTLQREPGPFVLAGKNSSLPPIPRHPGEFEFVGGTSLVFPNVTVTVAENHVTTVVAIPLAPNKTRTRMTWYFTGDAATSEDMAEHRKPVLDRWLGTSRDRHGNDGIRSQDFRIWEGQQIARQSAVADDVKFSPIWEQNIHHFHNQMINALT